jgi:hypothetical protein
LFSLRTGQGRRSVRWHQSAVRTPERSPECSVARRSSRCRRRREVSGQPNQPGRSDRGFEGLQPAEPCLRSLRVTPASGCRGQAWSRAHVHLTRRRCRIPRCHGNRAGDVLRGNPTNLTPFSRPRPGLVRIASRRPQFVHSGAVGLTGAWRRTDGQSTASGRWMICSAGTRGTYGASVSAASTVPRRRTRNGWLR